MPSAKVPYGALFPALVIALELHHRDQPPIEVETEAGHGHGLDVTDHLLGVLLGRGEDVDLGRPALLVHHDAGGGDFGDATQLMLEVRVPSIHHMPTLPGRGGTDNPLYCLRSI